MTTAQLRARLGWIVLGVGLLAAACIYLQAPAVEAPGVFGVDVPTKSQRLQLEKMGGKTLLLFEDLQEFWASLWRGRRLAATVAVLALAAFAGCRQWAKAAE
ncbi:MAG: hypothetical protein JSR82_15065 [Verrucomicrobia bacterium]|nr:hypothetical protein [Verrucomicrobiota bacterium]